jgi:molybdate transport system regulatory protein
MDDPEIEVGLKFWLFGPNDFTFGLGDALLLKSLIETPNLTIAAKACGYSYKYAWQKLKDIAKKTGKPVVETKKGGYGGGGEVHLTDFGLHLVKKFDDVEKKVNKFKHQVAQD